MAATLCPSSSSAAASESNTSVMPQVVSFGDRLAMVGKASWIIMLTSLALGVLATLAIAYEGLLPQWLALVLAGVAAIGAFTAMVLYTIVTVARSGRRHKVKI